MLESYITSLLYFSFIMLSFLLIANPIGVNKKGNIWLGIFILLWSTHWIDEILMILGQFELEPRGKLILSLVQFLTPLPFYFCVKNYTNPNYRFQFSTLSVLFVPIIFGAVLYGKSYFQEYYHGIFLFMVLSHAIFYIVKVYWLLQKHKKNILKFSSSPEEFNLSWLETIIYVLLIIALIITLFNIINFNAPLNLYMQAMFLFAVYFIAYYALKQKEIYPITESQTEEIVTIQNLPEKEIKKKVVDDEKLVKLKSDLNQLMLSEKPYLNCELNLVILAELMNTSSHILSYVINSGFNVNFPQFVNRYRVEFAKELLLDKEKTKQLSMLGIAFEAGFNSKTVFNTTFKKITGLTPTQFKKESSNS